MRKYWDGRVMNLRTGSWLAEVWSTSTSPRQALLAAHARMHGDTDTWAYEEMYGRMVEEGEEGLYLGDLAVFKHVKECGTNV